jgi:hypothetical protein
MHVQSHAYMIDNGTSMQTRVLPTNAHKCSTNTHTHTQSHIHNSKYSQMPARAGEDGGKSVLARVSIVDYHGNVIIDSFVAPQEKVTDLRTWVSGIR